MDSITKVPGQIVEGTQHVAVNVKNEFTDPMKLAISLTAFVGLAFIYENGVRRLIPAAPSIILDKEGYAPLPYIQKALTKTPKVTVQRDDTGAPSNQFIHDTDELTHSLRPRKMLKGNAEGYINTRALNNSINVADRTDTLYRSPNAYEPDISEKQLEGVLVGK